MKNVVINSNVTDCFKGDLELLCSLHRKSFSYFKPNLLNVHFITLMCQESNLDDKPERDFNNIKDRLLESIEFSKFVFLLYIVMTNHFMNDVMFKNNDGLNYYDLNDNIILE